MKSSLQAAGHSSSVSSCSPIRLCVTAHRVTVGTTVLSRVVSPRVTAYHQAPSTAAMARQEGLEPPPICLEVLCSTFTARTCSSLFATASCIFRCGDPAFVPVCTRLSLINCTIIAPSRTVSHLHCDRDIGNLASSTVAGAMLRPILRLSA